MDQYHSISRHLQENSYNWLITGVAGFIGSNLLEKLLNLNQRVVGIDNFSTGHQYNIDEVLDKFSINQVNKNFAFYEGDIVDMDFCQRSCSKVDFILHQAALGSIPRSIADPLNTHNSNINGFLNMLIAAKDNNIRRFVYASSSSVYGDHMSLPKLEENIGQALNPYAITKLVNEIYAKNFAKTFDYPSIGLRYFNIFGKRQDPKGPYAAVIPKWIASLSDSQQIHINGDGDTSRDFCFVDNAVQMNILAAMTENEDAVNQVYNVALNDRTSLNNLYSLICDIILKNSNGELKEPIYKDFRAGDIRHSQADISKAKNLLGYNPTHYVKDGLTETIEWFLDKGRA